jgi:hypothetical protein
LAVQPLVAGRAPGIADEHATADRIQRITIELQRGTDVERALHARA